MAFLAAAIKSLPLILDLIAKFKASADAAHSEGIGYDRAVLKTLQSANTMLEVAHQVEADAAKDHATRSNDTAFDSEFERRDI